MSEAEAWARASKTVSFADAYLVQYLEGASV